MSQVANRTIRLLWMLAEKPRTVASISDELGVHPTTVLRLVHVLRDWRMVEQVNGNYVRLGSGLMYLGQQAGESYEIQDIAGPYMDRLSDLTGETINLAVFTEGHVVYVSKRDSVKPTRIYSQVGRIAPLHCTGVAKAILAFLDQEYVSDLLSRQTFTKHTDKTITSRAELLHELEASRSRGFAVDDQEHEVGIHCVAAPIFYSDGSVVASLSVAALSERFAFADLIELSSHLKEIAAEASRDLGYRMSFRTLR